VQNFAAKDSGLPTMRSTRAAAPPSSAPASGSLADDVSPADYDALADLFLTDGCLSATTIVEPPPRMSGRAAPTAPAAAAAQAPALEQRVESLILGHLPILAAAWAPQYARMVAARSGFPVAFVRLHAGQITIELVGQTSQPPAPGGGACSQDLGDALRMASKTTGHFLFRTDDHEEAVVAHGGAISRITLLSGADDAALVASYRTLKGLCANAESNEPMEAETIDPVIAPELHVVIMGAEPARAASAEAKLTRTARTFLDRPISVEQGAQKIHGMPTTLLFRGPTQLSAVELAAKLRHWSGAKGFGENGGSKNQQAREASLAPAVVESKPGEKHVKPGESMKLVGSEVIDDDRLSRHLPGITPVLATCPYAEGVELAIDPAGALHLMASVKTREGGSLSDAISRLIAASGWALDHASLLNELIRLGRGLSTPAVLPAADGPATRLHLFTDDPRPARRLLDSGVQFHLLSSVRVGHETIWLCSDLN